MTSVFTGCGHGRHFKHPRSRDVHTAREHGIVCTELNIYHKFTNPKFRCVPNYYNVSPAAVYTQSSLHCSRHVGLPTDQAKTAGLHSMSVDCLQ